MDRTGPTPMTLAKAAVGVCALGLLGLLLPFVDAPFGYGGSLLALKPGLGVLLLLLFLGITSLPVLDVRSGRLLRTPWLAVPGGIGVIGGLMVWLGFSSVSARDGLAGLAVSSGFVSLGTGFALMLLASFGLVGVGVYGFVLQRAHTPWSPPLGAPWGPPAGPPPAAPRPPSWGNSWETSRGTQPWAPPRGPRPPDGPGRPVEQPGPW